MARGLDAGAILSAAMEGERLGIGALPALEEYALAHSEARAARLIGEAREAAVREASSWRSWSVAAQMAGGGTEEAFCLKITNQSASKVYGYHFGYALGGEPMGGGSVVCADGSPLSPGEVLTRDLLPRELQESTDLDGSVDIAVILADGTEAPAGGDVHLQSGVWQETYTFRLLEAEGEGVQLVRG